MQRKIQLVFYFYALFFMLIGTEALAQITVSPFKNGFAKIVDNGQPYYINTKGEKVEKGVDPIDDKSNMSLPEKPQMPFFDEIGYLDGEHYDVKDDGKWHLYSNSQKKIITKEPYDGFDYCGGCGSFSPYVYAQKNGKWGIIDWKENVLVPFEYEHMHRGMRSDNWVNSFSKSGRRVVVHIPTQKEFYGGEILMGLLTVEKNSQYGAYGQDGDLKIPFEYDKIELPNANSYLGYHGNYLITTKQHKKGVLDLDGMEMLPAEYDDIKIYDDYFVVKQNNISYLLDSTQRVLTMVEHGEISHVDDYFYSSGSKGREVFKIKKRAYYGLFFAKTGQEVAPAFYEVDFFNFQTNDVPSEFLTGKKNGMSTIFDDNGNMLLEDCQEINAIYHASDDLVRYTQNGKTGIYDLKEQKEILPMSYDHIEVAHLERTSLSSDHLLLSMEGKEKNYVLLHTESLHTEKLDYGTIYTINSPRLLIVSEDNITGKLYDIEWQKELEDVYDLQRLKHGYLVQTPENHMVISPFENGMALVYDQRGYGLIDVKGELAIQPQYTQIRNINQSTYLLLKKGEHLGVADARGNIVVPVEYEDMILKPVLDYNEAQNAADSIFPLLVYKEGKWRYVDLDGSYLPIVGDYVN